MRIAKLFSFRQGWAVLEVSEKAVFLNSPKPSHLICAGCVALGINTCVNI